MEGVIMYPSFGFSDRNLQVESEIGDGKYRCATVHHSLLDTREHYHSYRNCGLIRRASDLEKREMDRNSNLVVPLFLDHAACIRCK